MRSATLFLETQSRAIVAAFQLCHAASDNVVCTKTWQQSIWAGGVPLHYSYAAAAALE